MRATWVWDRPQPRGLVGWVGQQSVGELFVHVAPDLPRSPDLAWVRSLSRLAREVHIKISALGGDPAWLDRPEAALAWQSAVLSTGLFDGVHVDVEPWVRADWESRRAELVARYLEVHRRLAGETTLPLEADIAPWLHEVESADGPLDAALMRLLDAVTVMSYRNTATGPDGITAIAAQALGTATHVGIPCRLAVETRYLGPDPVSRKQTFHGLGWSALADAMASVDEHASGVASYHGIAVHDQAGWWSLLRRQS